MWVPKEDPKLEIRVRETDHCTRESFTDREGRGREGTARKISAGWRRSCVPSIPPTTPLDVAHSAVGSCTWGWQLTQAVMQFPFGGSTGKGIEENKKSVDLQITENQNILFVRSSSGHESPISLLPYPLLQPLKIFLALGHFLSD